MAENVIKISFELENVGKGKAFKETENKAKQSGAKAGKNYGKAFSKSASSTISGLRNKFFHLRPHTADKPSGFLW